MFIIPLANAFRDTFTAELINLTKLIKALKIPCIVVGVGLQADYEPDFSNGFSFDNVVKDFVNAVLEKSVSIGVRGEITATYLRKLGYTEEQVNVIGCPSMFMNGEFLSLKNPKQLTRDSVITISYHGHFKNYFKFLERCKIEYPNYYIIPQGIDDLRLLYAGDRIINKQQDNPYYIKDITNYSYLNNHMRMFINVPSWISFLEKADIGVGSCIHGSIASVLAGNPTFVFAYDSRVRELAEYHHICHKKLTDINDDTNLSELYENTDFSYVLNGHKGRYENYLSFMRKNGINVKPQGWSTSTALDKKMNELHLCEPDGVVPYIHLPYEEQKERLSRYLKMTEGKINWWNKQDIPLQKKESNRKKWDISRECTLERLNSY